MTRAVFQQVTMGLSEASASHTAHTATLHVVSPVVMLAGYMLMLSVLVVFGFCRGWQKPGEDGNGGGGPPGPPAREPTPPGGRQLSGDFPEQTVADDFRAWEEQMRTPHDKPAQERSSGARSGRSVFD
jgi:hypothetical protein